MSRTANNKMRRAPSRGKAAASGENDLTGVVKRNVAAIERHQRDAYAQRSLKQRAADAITRVSGSLGFVFAHVVWFSAWVALNLGLLGIPPFDPYPFGLLTTIVSLEAIFLSTFVLVSQNRQAAIADRRAQLDLQINLLAEREVTRLLKMQNAIARHLGVNECDGEELRELEQDVEPEAVLSKIEATAETSAGGEA